MAYDDGLAQVFRDDLGDAQGIIEKKMFGGLCFMNRGNMLCGVMRSKDGEDKGMFRVGPDNYAKALKMPLASEMSMTGRPMKGIVETSAEIFDDEKERRELMDMALEFTNSLPPK